MKKERPPFMDLDQPPYDERSGSFWKAGESYGVGKAQPVGQEKSSKKEGVPRGCWSKKIER